MVKISIKYLLLIIVLQSCVPFGLYQNAYKATEDLFNSPSFEITTAIKNLPYAMQLVEHEGKSAVMVLANVDDNKLTWVDSENNGFTTMQGKIIATNGLVNDFDSINPPELRTIFFKLRNIQTKSLNKISMIRFLRPMTSYFRAEHIFTLREQSKDLFRRKIDGKFLEYFILEERVKVDSILWEFTNYYWLTIDGHVLRSKQFVTPDQSKYFLETLKGYGD